MKKFEKPVYEFVRFGSNIITASGCSCFYEEIGFDLISDTVCPGANVACTCNPNYDDPNTNCADPT